MATIKRAGNRIITKVVNGQRRVSCSCCPSEGCCMYSAQGLIDGLFTVADLPNQIAMRSDGGDVLGKIDPPVPAFGAEGITMYYGSAGEGVGIEDATGGWVFFIDGGINPDAIFNPACLFSDANVPQTPPFDTFADSYQVAGDGGAVTVTRISLCRWEGFGNQGIASLTFRNTDDDGAPAQKWSASIETGSGQQGGQKSNQSSPVGTYDQNMSAPQLSPIVVSEA
jgi:hypothetical protein